MYIHCLHYKNVVVLIANKNAIIIDIQCKQNTNIKATVSMLNVCNWQMIKIAWSFCICCRADYAKYVGQQNIWFIIVREILIIANETFKPLLWPYANQGWEAETNKFDSYPNAQETTTIYFNVWPFLASPVTADFSEIEEKVGGLKIPCLGLGNNLRTFLKTKKTSLFFDGTLLLLNPSISVFEFQNRHNLHVVPFFLKLNGNK